MTAVGANVLREAAPASEISNAVRAKKASQRMPDKLRTAFRFQETVAAAARIFGEPVARCHSPYAMSKEPAGVTHFLPEPLAVGKGVEGGRIHERMAAPHADVTRVGRYGPRAAGTYDGAGNRKGYGGHASMNHPRRGTASRSGTAASHQPRAGTPRCRRRVPRRRSSGGRPIGEACLPCCPRRENAADWLSDSDRSFRGAKYGQTMEPPQALFNTSKRAKCGAPIGRLDSPCETCGARESLVDSASLHRYSSDMRRLLLLAATTCVWPFLPAPVLAQYAVENLGRGVMAIRASESTVYVGWRLLGTDPADVAFNVYRATGAAAPTKLNDVPVATATNVVDLSADLNQVNTYTVRPVLRGTELAASSPFVLPADAPIQQYLTVPLDQPAAGAVEVPRVRQRATTPTVRTTPVLVIWMATANTRSS